MRPQIIPKIVLPKHVLASLVPVGGDGKSNPLGAGVFWAGVVGAGEMVGGGSVGLSDAFPVGPTDGAPDARGVGTILGALLGAEVRPAKQELAPALEHVGVKASNC